MIVGMRKIAFESPGCYNIDEWRMVYIGIEIDEEVGNWPSKKTTIGLWCMFCIKNICASGCWKLEKKYINVCLMLYWINQSESKLSDEEGLLEF
jgi:hypothetical protein